MKIVVSHATKEIHGIKVLKDVSMALESGSVYGFLGRNGSGKTMMMRALCGFISLTEGSIEMDGSRLGSGEDFPRNLGMLLETPVFLPERTGYENLRLLAAIRGEAAGDDIRKALEQVGLDRGDRRKVGKYSLGMRQRLGIACAIMEGPELLILDEPFNGLDEGGCKMLRELIVRYRKEGCLIVLACHDREELEFLSDTIYRVDSGSFTLM
ncbi:taurine import ATP-binding protein TauB [Lachnospiraceae bacterium]|nr:taurine import ATP-binding protein TauB [Lachnospiraceae bacterium]